MYFHIFQGSPRDVAQHTRDESHNHVSLLMDYIQRQGLTPSKPVSSGSHSGTLVATGSTPVSECTHVMH